MGKTLGPNTALPGLTVRAINCVASDEGTADCALFCRCDDGSDYAVKDKSKSAATPHSEWFCTRFGESVGLASPTCAIVDINGVESFGSRYETGHEPDNWWVRAKSGEINFDQLAPTVSRIFAFDLFVHNGDRHLKNYIIRKQKLGYSILSFDYSRAWLWNGFPLPKLPLLASSNTIRAQRFLSQAFPGFLSIFDINHVLDRIRETDRSKIETIFGEHPKDWLTDAERNALLEWWESNSRLQRINSIKEGITNGTYL